MSAFVAPFARALGEAPLEGFPLERLVPGAEIPADAPSPAALLGFELGARPLTTEEVQRVVRRLAEGSPRARLIEYARSWEGRPLYALAISDEETIASLDEFRALHARRVDPRGRAPERDDAALAGAKAVAWMAAAIHGDELSGAEGALALAAWLALGEDEGARRAREAALVLVDPLQNPDGRARYLAQIAAFAHARPNPDSDDLSHAGVWPWGRGNHYLFDLNRDWFSMVHPESRRSAEIASWHPQLVVDAHEMGAHSTYLFSPARHPFNPFLPASNERWRVLFGRDQAEGLDALGYPYYTREWNEEFFPGYGSSWASYLGAVGILYEMSRTTGTLVRQRRGTIRTFPEAVEHQAASFVANLMTLVEHREALLADFVRDRRVAMARANEEGEPAAWWLPEGAHPERTRRLVRLLAAQGLEISRLGEGARRGSCIDAREGTTREAASMPGAVHVVRLDQPLAPLARVLLDPHVPMAQPFLAEEREYLERGKGSRLYETTAWSLPLLYDVDACWSAALPAPLEEAKASALADGPAPHAARATSAASESPAFGFAFDGRPDQAPALAYELLESGLAVELVDEALSTAGESFERGVFVVRREGQPAGFAARVRESARRRGVELLALGSALAEEGPDLGGRHVRSLVLPRIAVLAGYPVSPTSYGALWHLVDQELGARMTALDAGRLGRADLRRYNVLVVPPTYGGEGALRALLGENGLTRLAEWVEQGGTLVAIGSSAALFTRGEEPLSHAQMRADAIERFPPVVVGLEASLVAEAGPLRSIGLRGDDELPSSLKPSEGGVERSSPYDLAPLIGPGAAPFVRGVDLGTPATLTPRDLDKWVRPLLPPGRDDATTSDLESADLRLRRFMPRGAILRVELDREHWLAFGARDATLPVLSRARDALVAPAPVEVAGRFAGIERLQMGGLLWPEAAGRLAHTAWATREAKGKGQLLLFVDEPEYRGWTLGSRRVLVNALVLGPGLGASWPSPR